MRPASLTASTPLISSTPTLSSPTRRAVEIEDDAGHGRAHHREIDEMARIGADRRADIEHDALAAHGRPQAGDRRPVDLRHRLQAELRHRHQRAGIAGRDGDVGLAGLGRVDGAPHRGLVAAIAQGLARLVVHLHRDLGVMEGRDRLELGMGVEQRQDLLLVAEDDEARIGAALQRQRSARDDDSRAVIPAHRIERDCNRSCHGVLVDPRSGRPSIRGGSIAGGTIATWASAASRSDSRSMRFIRPASAWPAPRKAIRPLTASGVSKLAPGLRG